MEMITCIEDLIWWSFGMVYLGGVITMLLIVALIEFGWLTAPRMKDEFEKEPELDPVVGKKLRIFDEMLQLLREMDEELENFEKTEPDTNSD